jgi:DsbC/DsbD-like thiol-disulfide interchange protein
VISILALFVLNKTPQCVPDLVSDHLSVQPGSQFRVALRLKIAPEWHVYWKNPGESGIPPSIDWQLPTGWKAGEIMWPIPFERRAAGITTYNYSNEVLLVVPIQVPKGAKLGTATLQASASWLVCREKCLPGSEKLSLRVTVGQNKEYLKYVQAFSQLRRPAGIQDWKLSSQRQKNNVSLFIELPESPLAGELPQGTKFFPVDTFIDPSAPQPMTSDNRHYSLKLQISAYAESSTHRLQGLLVAPPGKKFPGGCEAVTIDVPIHENKP